jgi:hypothetical protein
LTVPGGASRLETIESGPIQSVEASA